MALKITLFFQQGAEGWSEVYYTNHGLIEEFTGTPPGDFKAGTPASNLLKLRKTLIQPDTVLNHIRVSNMAQPGAFLPYDLDDTQAHGTYAREGAINQDSTEIFSSLLLTFLAGSVARRKLFLGGIPEENVKAPQAYRPRAEFRANLEEFLKLVGKTPYCMRSRPSKATDFGNRIQAFTVLGSGQDAIVTPRIRPADNPQEWYILIRGMKGPVGWNGVHRARSVDNPANSMQIGPTNKIMRDLPAFIAGNPGIVQLFTPAFPVITTWNIGRIVSRKRGRPFGQSRGRRS